MGIIDNKSRIFDTQITDYGKQEMSKGNFKISFAAFSDKYAQYIGDINSGSLDISNNLYFESVSLDSDQITFEADDSGKLMPFGKNGKLTLFGGKILSSSISEGKKFITGSSQFASLSEVLFSGSIENFNNLRIIGTKDIFSDSEEFNLSESSIKYSITDEKPLTTKEIQSICIDDVENIFQDKRLSHIPNFKFLPPINKPNSQEPKGSPLGTFCPIGQDNFTVKDSLSTSKILGSDYKSIIDELRGKENYTIEFTETSKENNIICQFFEKTKNDLLKLDVIDFGIFPSPGKNSNPHVFFVGKIFLDSFNRHTFVNLFTLIFS